MRIEAGAAVLLAGAVIAWIVVDGRFGVDDNQPATLVVPHAANAMASAASRAGDGAGDEAGDGEGEARHAEVSPSNDAMTAPASAPASSPGVEVPAAWSLADARVAGDDRAPPIERSTPEATTPAWQLDDHQGYARREQDRHQSVRRAFVDAADRELPQLDQQIEQGRAMGVSPEQLAKGEEKRRRIAEMRARMRAELAASATAP